MTQAEIEKLNFVDIRDLLRTFRSVEVTDALVFNARDPTLGCAIRSFSTACPSSATENWMPCQHPVRRSESRCTRGRRRFRCNSRHLVRGELRRGTAVSAV